MSVVVSERDDHHELICKGALAEIPTVCTRVRIENGHGPREVPLDAAMLARVQQVTRGLNEEGLRVVAVAMKELAPSQTLGLTIAEIAFALEMRMKILLPVDGSNCTQNKVFRPVTRFADLQGWTIRVANVSRSRQSTGVRPVRDLLIGARSAN